MGLYVIGLGCIGGVWGARAGDCCLRFSQSALSPPKARTSPTELPLSWDDSFTCHIPGYNTTPEIVKKSIYAQMSYHHHTLRDTRTIRTNSNTQRDIESLIRAIYQSEMFPKYFVKLKVKEQLEIKKLSFSKILEYIFNLNQFIIISFSIKMVMK